MSSDLVRQPVHKRHIRRSDQFGAALRSVRLHHGMTQAEVAEKARVTRKWLSQVENGKRTAELGLVCRVVDILGCEIHLVTVSEPSLDLEAHVAALADSGLEP